MKWIFFVWIFFTESSIASPIEEKILKKPHTLLTQNLTTSSNLQIPKWSLQWSAYQLNFRGERPAASLLYDFGRISTLMNVLSVNYQWNSRWSSQIIAQHYDTSFEAFFPLAPPPWQRSKNQLLGLGDTSLNTIYLVEASATKIITAHLGLSLPTGSIDIKNTLPGLTQINLGYNAQLGSGTYDLLFAGTALFLQPSFSLGSRLATTVHTGINSNGYRLGNIYRLDSWIDYKLNQSFVARLTGQYRHRDGLVGFDQTRGKTAADNFFFEDQINWDISTALQYKILWPQAKLGLTAELGVPVLQDNINADNSFVAAVYYASISLNAVF